MRLPFSELRRAILEVVQPLAVGRFSKKDQQQSQLSDIPQFDGADKFTDAGTPFGFSSTPTKNTLAYYLNAGGSALSQIIVGHKHLARPLGAEGSLIQYSTDASGENTKAKVTCFPDGSVEIEGIDSGIKIKVSSDGKIYLGSNSSDEPLVLGNAFKTLYNAHVHIGNLGVPTGVPQVPMDATQLSAKSFTEL